MTTMVDFIDNMPVASTLMKYGKRVIPVEDVLREAKRSGIKNPKRELEIMTKAGLIKITRNYIVVPEYKS